MQRQQILGRSLFGREHQVLNRECFKLRSTHQWRYRQFASLKLIGQCILIVVGQWKSIDRLMLTIIHCLRQRFRFLHKCSCILKVGQRCQCIPMSSLIGRKSMCIVVRYIPKHPCRYCRPSCSCNRGCTYRWGCYQRYKFQHK